MRVLWVIKSLGPGGAERLLCAHARAIDHQAWHVECAYVTFQLDQLASELTRANVPTQCMSRSARDPWWPLRLVRLIRRGEWDVVHVHSPLPASIARLAVVTMRRVTRPAIVCTEHNAWGRYHRVTRWLNAWTSRMDTATIAVSGEVARSLAGAAARRVISLRHGIDLEAVAAMRDDRTATRAEVGLGAEEFVFVTAASFTPQKDYPNLLRAVHSLAQAHVPCRLLVLGRGPDEDDIVRLSNELGLGERVVFAGFRADAPRFLAACDVFVLASAWEGLPVSIMEACALGLPIVATRTGGIVDEFVNERDALVVPTRDAVSLAAALRRVHDDATLRTALAAAARVKAARFDVHRTHAEIESIYRTAVLDRSQRRASQ